MKSLTHSLSLILVLLFLASCSTQKNRKSHELMRQQARDKKYLEALELVKSDDFFPEENSKLLKLLELATLQYLNHHYRQAQMTFDKAKELSDELFTVSISKKAASALANDTFDNYYGERFERSMIRFYQVLNHYSLYMIGKYEPYELLEKDKKGKIVNVIKVPPKVLSENEKRQHLIAARSVLLEWNSLLDSYKAESGGRPVYKDDLLAKVFGGFIHEQLGSNDDLRIARDLYKEAKKILFRNFNMLPTYNKKHKEFVSKFSEFSNMDEKVVEKNYVQKTSSYLSLEKFLDEQVNRVSANKPNSVFFLMENGLVMPKKVKKFDFPVPVTRSAKPGSNNDFAGFVMSALNTAANATPKIYFEMPQIPYTPPIEDQMINILDKNGKLVASKKTATLNPLSDLAHYVLESEAIANYAKVGGRVVAKHVSALTSAYFLYQKQKPLNEFVAMSMASSAYAFANKGIQASEQADLRSWNMLPHMFSTTAFDLKPGTYKAEFVSQNKKEDLGEFTVDKSSKTLLLKFRSY